MKSKDLDKASENILSEYGEQIARHSQSCGSFPARREARRILREMERVLAAREESDEGAWRWICDNRYLVEREARSAAMEFFVWPGKIKWRMSTPRVIMPSPSYWGAPVWRTISAMAARAVSG